MKCKKPLNRSITIGCILFIATLCVILDIANYIGYRQALYKSYEDYITDLLMYVSYNIDADDLENCLETNQKSEKYDELQVLLDAVKETHDIDWLYVIVPLSTETNDNVKNVIAAMTQYEKDFVPENSVELNELTGESYPPETVAKYLNAVNTEGRITFFEEFAEWGNDYTGVLPLVDSSGNYVAELCIDVRVEEIHKTIKKHMIFTSSIVLGVGALFTLGFIMWARRNIVQPIKSVEQEVVNFANHSHEQKDLGMIVIQDPGIKTENEIQSLSKAVEKMSLDMRDYVIGLIEAERLAESMKNTADRMSELANKDSLTGIRNKTAYDNEVKKLEHGLENGETKFGAAMIDLNFLKKINDTYGHDKGNAAIKKLCRLVCVTFSHSPVFRIGGDEFAVILKGNDYEHIDELIDSFNDKLTEMNCDSTLEEWEKISAAIGFSKFDEQSDKSFDSVFKRADEAMYANKKAMKAVRTE